MSFLFKLTAALFILFTQITQPTGIVYAGTFKRVAIHPHAAQVHEPIKEIVVYNDALYLGYGNQERNEIAPLKVCHYRPSIEELICDFTFGTSEIRNFKVIDNQLHIPATDPAETVSYDGYAIFDANATDNKWTRVSARNFIEDEHNKHDWLVHAVDVAKYKGALWLTDTGAFPKHTHLKRRFGHFSGDIYRSDDGGLNWVRSNVGHTLNYSLFVYQDKLYSPSPVSTRGLAQYRPSMVFDGESWQTTGDFVLPRPKPLIRKIYGEHMGVIFRLGQKLERGILDHLRVFKGKAIVMQALHGGKLNIGGNPVVYNKHIGNILTASDDLSSHMDTSNIVLGNIDTFEFVNDYCIAGDTLYALMQDGEIRYSQDLEKWHTLKTKFTLGHPYSIEVLNGDIFIGSNNGHLYQYVDSPVSAPVSDAKNNIEKRNR